MEVKNGRISINRKEMQSIKKMDHQQIEDRLTAAYRLGQAEMAELRQKLDHDRKIQDLNWQQAVFTSMEQLKGLGEKRKELFTEYLKENLKKVGICIK